LTTEQPKEATVSTVLTELRRKYPGPDGRRKALRKLGFDQSLIDQLLRKPAATVPKRTRIQLGYDSGETDRHSRTEASERKKADLEAILVKYCSGPELERARSLIENLFLPGEADSFLDPVSEDDEFELSANPKSQKGNPDIDPVLEEIRTLLHEAKFQGGEADDEGETERRLVKLEKLLQSHGLSEGEVSDAMSRLKNDFAASDNFGIPKNGVEGGVGGRFAAANDRKRRMARDAARVAALSFKERFPEIANARLTGTALEAGISGSESETRPRRIASDASSKAVKSFQERFPASDRIGFA
jgi:hypothetical protein